MMKKLYIIQAHTRGQNVTGSLKRMKGSVALTENVKQLADNKRVSRLADNAGVSSLADNSGCCLTFSVSDTDT